MSTLTKIIIGLLLILGIFAGGFFLGRGNKQIEIKEKIIEGKTIIKEVEVVRWKEKIIKPDGTIIEREGEKLTDKEREDQIRREEREKMVKPLLANYSLGISAYNDLQLSSLTEQPKFQVDFGRRVLGDIWVTVGGNQDKQLFLGLRYDF